MRSPETSVTKLLQRIKDGQLGARRELFYLLADERKFGAVLLAIAHKLLPRSHPARRLMDTHDVVQSALGTGLHHFSDFRGNSESELYGWFRSIIRNKITRVSRRVGRDPKLCPADHLPEEWSDDQSEIPLGKILDDELKMRLHDAIQKLPLAQRLVVELRLRDINAPQIGAILGLNPATVRKRESRAVKQLKCYMEQAG